MNIFLPLMSGVIAGATLSTLNVYPNSWQWWVLSLLPNVFGIACYYDQTRNN